MTVTDTTDALYATAQFRAHPIAELEKKRRRHAEDREHARAEIKRIRLDYLKSCDGRNEQQRESQLQDLPASDTDHIDLTEQERYADHHHALLTIDIDLEDRLFRLDLAALHSVGPGSLQAAASPLAVQPRVPGQADTIWHTAAPPSTLRPLAPCPQE